MIYDKIFRSKEKKLAVLIDPGKTDNLHLTELVSVSQRYKIDFFLVGGSIISQNIDKTIDIIKQNSDIPVALFPGSVYQLSDKADAVLLLSLISGRNPEFLIGNHVIAAPFLKQSKLEIISTGYMLIDGENKTSVEYMSNTKPIPGDKTDIAAATAIAGEMLGMKVLYLEAGSGAKNPVNKKMISVINSSVDIPIIVGGGIRDAETLKKIYNAGADIAVVGTAFENNIKLAEELSRVKENFNHQY